MSVSALAKVIGRHRGSVQRWLSQYRDNGLTGLLKTRQRSGRPVVICFCHWLSLYRRSPIWRRNFLIRYNTRVGERGSALSGGQRQCITIARTVLQRTHLLILDEATSALDLHSERQVCQNLMETFRGRTVFFITHRLATIRSADRILMMDKGAIAEQDTHAELMAMQGLYYCLYQQQDASGE